MTDTAPEERDEREWTPPQGHDLHVLLQQYERDCQRCNVVAPVPMGLLKSLQRQLYFMTQFCQDVTGFPPEEQSIWNIDKWRIAHGMAPRDPLLQYWKWQADMEAYSANVE